MIVPPSWCDVHHVLEWDADEGPTNAENGCMLCRRHHRKLHAGRGYSAKLLPDGTLEVTYPDGRVESSRSRGTIVQPFW